MLDLAKEKISEKIDENKAKAEISRYLESQHFEIPLFENEIDADGLKQFICGSGTALLKNRCFSGKAAERGQAHISFIEGAVNAAKPSNKESERKIRGFAGAVIDIFCDFYSKKNSKELRLLFNLQNDEMRSVVKEAVNDISERIQDLADREKRFRKMAADHNYKDMSREIQHLIDIASDSHPVSGYYFTQLNGNLTSVPVSEDVLRIKPPSIVASLRAEMDGKEISSSQHPIGDLLKYADNHQKTIQFTIIDAVKFLGDEEDPVQHEAEQWIGKKINRPPTPFPPGIHCSLIINGETYIEDLFLRTYEKKEDGTILIDNREQKDFGLRFSFAVNQELGAEVTYQYNPETSNGEKCLFYRIAKAMEEAGSIDIVNDGRTIMCGSHKAMKHEVAFESTDDAIEFFRRCAVIDKCYGCSITPRSEITYKDVDLLYTLSDILEGKTVEEKWIGRVELVGTLGDDLSDLTNNIGEPFTSIIPYRKEINLFDNTFYIRVKRAYTDGLLEDPSGFSKKVNALDSGDPIKAIIHSTENSVMAEWIDAEYYVKDNDEGAGK